LLHDWLQSWLPGVRQGVVEVVPYLTGTEDVYVQDQTNSKFLRPAVTTRIDEKLWESGKFRGSKVRLHDAGGIPAVSDMLRSLARFRFGPDNVQYRLPVESDEQPERLSDSLTTAVENLEARRRVCDLVRRGEFQAAKGLADECATSADRVNALWVRCVDAVARYFQGYMTHARNRAAKLTSTNTGASLQALLPDHNRDRWPQSLHIAMRAQAALTAQDFLSAAALTVTFFDVALLDGIVATLYKHSDQSKQHDKPLVDWSRREIRRDQFRPNDLDLRSCALAVQKGVGWRPSFDLDKDLNPWIQKRTLRANQPWQKCTLSRAIREVGKHRKLAQALDALLEGLYKGANKDDDTPANFRNIITHSLPEQHQIEQMVKLFADRSLWYGKADQAMSFLDSSTRPATVLTALGVDDAEHLYQQLIDGLVNDIEACPIS